MMKSLASILWYVNQKQIFNICILDTTDTLGREFCQV
jgi:hypothetical protein